MNFSEKYGYADICPKGGKHEIDPKTCEVYEPRSNERLQDVTVDFNCCKCGRSGSVSVGLTEPNW
jgi:hypothetical protein